MDKTTRNAIERATQKARHLLEAEFEAQLEGTFDILPDGSIAEHGGPHLTSRQAFEQFLTDIPSQTGDAFKNLFHSLEAGVTKIGITSLTERLFAGCSTTYRPKRTRLSAN